MTPIEAERAFAADAQTIGQWTAFRKWAAEDATMFVPQPVEARAWLVDKKDPKKAIDWWPIASWISCDGKVAVNKGGWARPDGSVGYFTTVWQRQADGGWKWVVDSGDSLKIVPERPAEPKVIRAQCGKAEFPNDDVMAIKEGYGGSPDQTLDWLWRIADNGGRTLMVWIYNGTKFVPVVADDISAAPK